MKKTVQVVAAIIENEHREILCALRSGQMSLPNMWEFPGGKVKEGENLFTALERELYEEMSCRIQAQEVFHENVHEYDTFIIQLIVIKAELVQGVPQTNEHAKLIWLQRENLPSLHWAPADMPAVEALMNEPLKEQSASFRRQK
ncbi:(deoxy)nucleoside triphosphate pyrophosphohydrolase [Oceanobacillus sojae]|uniref:(deoxy)nucleoside triphosphate pyrophosphohydrolase n=1 Tax=Oceanobacillus sojae TaxID=582851 RepID=UPI00098838C1|nr:(deoxy)nucleoside triphosphate pyrophosphohydrolase [Oceanobacillus sojae]MCT1901468.1 (deoxy)nucleoside triphosphate pyrophosphohydrolase [Oceanobacillus sojae]